MYKDKPGIAGFVFDAFRRRSRVVPAVASWGYSVAWGPVIGIQVLLLGDYLHGFVFPGIPPFTRSLVFGSLMFALLLL